MISTNVSLPKKNKDNPYVLTNDLIATFSRADETNRECLGEIIKFIYYELPSQCWGNAEKYTHWIQFGENSPYG